MRLRAQQLISGNFYKPDAVVSAVCGLQAQDAQAAILSARVRSSGLTVGDMEQAMLHDRSIIRTWAMRGTLHLIATEDLSWLLALLGPVFVAADRRRRLQLG
ncbi:MAG TPA: crosslink repair DNA glycosylase YcaQ family protein, partial [Aggregatilineales bacterium]|nr:crosslink repair DNA glycosylase YcaQ family protein [Aggregatilineales bacterium]